MKDGYSEAIFAQSIDTLESLGVSTDSFVSQFGLGALLKRRSFLRTVPLSVGLKLWDFAYQETGDPHVALKSAAQAKFGVLPLVDYLTASSRSPVQALKLFTLSARRFSDSLDVSYNDLDESSILNLSFAPSQSVIEDTRLNEECIRRSIALINEYTFANILRVLDYSTVAELPVEKIQFRHDCYGKKKDYAKYFSAPVEFSSHNNCIHFFPRINEMKNQVPNVYMYSVLIKELFHRQDCIGADELVIQIQEIVRANLNCRENLMSFVLGQLSQTGKALTVRTLQRTLAQRGMTFEKIVLEIKIEESCRLLRERELTNEEIATVLGFSNGSSFSRFFRRYIGLSPSEFTPLEAFQKFD